MLYHVAVQQLRVSPASNDATKKWFVSLAILLSLVASACSSGAPTEVSSALDSVESVTPEPTSVPPTAVPTSAPIVAPTPVPPPTPMPIPEPTPEFGPTGRPSAATEVNVLTAKPSVRRPVVYDGPEGSEIPVRYEYLSGAVDETYDWFINPTFFGNALALMVLEGEPGDDWAKVQIPTRPIMEGWVATDEFTWSSSDYYVQVDISTNTVKVWRGDEVIVDEVAVVTGDVGRETPIASTYVDEIMPGPSGAYGPWLLSLGVFSEAINTFGSAGGLPKVALHGTNRPDLLGQYASNGCIRLPNDVISMLAAEVPVGTRVDLIRSS
jgi:hypothetical protein